MINGALSYTIRKRLKETRKTFCEKLGISTAIYSCFEDDLFPQETFKDELLKKVRTFIESVINTKPLDNNEKIIYWKKSTGMKEKDLAQILDISVQTLTRYKNCKYLLSSEMIEKIEKIVNPKFQKN